MCLDCFSEETPCGSILISEHLSYGTTISLRIFGDHLIYGRFICINSAILIINIR